EERAVALLGNGSWEGRHGGLLLLQECLKLREQGEPCSLDCGSWLDPCLTLLSDKEIRVRTLSGEIVATLCQFGGRELYSAKVAGPLLSSIEGNLSLERDGQAFLDDDEATKALADKLMAGEAAREAKKAASKAGSRASRASSLQSTIYHDTAGWGSLETDVACLRLILERCGPELAPCVAGDGEALEVLLSCTAHLNRFVRGAAFRAIDAVVKSLQSADAAAGGAGGPLLDAAAASTDLLSRMCAGVCDEWANVRMDASVPLRSFMLALGSPERREPYLCEVLPRMCVNRYYVAAGLAAYSQKTWKLVLGAEGKEAVVRWLPSIVPFYILQTKVANSEAREASCKCIGELAARVDPAVVSPHATALFEALLPRLSRRDAWQVKLAACVAVGDLVRAFPEKFNLGAADPKLLHLLSALLADAVWSVREQAAVLLGQLVKLSGDASARAVQGLCLEGLAAASKVPDERKKYGQEDLAALKRERDNDATLHSDQEAIDCCAVGDLDQEDSEQLTEPGKLNLSAVYMQAREEQEALGLDSWERTDGCLYLARELAHCAAWRPRASEGGGAAGACLEELVAHLARAAALRHFVKHLVLLATLWGVLPEIAEAVGAESFRPHLAEFAGALAYSVSCQEGLAADAARRCVCRLGSLLGRQAFSPPALGLDTACADALLACLAPE
ncbi:unnamed protein product, partial [Prorocentrum cordatum]